MFYALNVFDEKSKVQWSVNMWEKLENYAEYFIKRDFNVNSIKSLE